MPAEPRILFLTRKWAPAVGGMETYSMRLTEALAKIEPVEVVAIRGNRGARPPSALALLRFPVTALIRCLQRQTPPQVIHVGDMAIWPLGLMASLLFGACPVVISAHGTDVSYAIRTGLRGTLYRAYLKLGARLMRGSKVISNSEATAAAATAAGWPCSAIVPLASDLTVPDPAPSDHTSRLLFAGRLIPLKGCRWFVREVLHRLPAHIVLDVAGPRWDPSETVVIDDPRVCYLGTLDREALAAAYRKALAVIVPNINLPTGQFEGFGLIAVEAARAGGLVLCSDQGGLREAVIDGHTGFLISAGDAAAWANKITEVADWDTCQRARFTAEAQAQATSRFSWDRVAQETYALYGLAK